MESKDLTVTFYPNGNKEICMSQSLEDKDTKGVVTMDLDKDKEIINSGEDINKPENENENTDVDKDVKIKPAPYQYTVDAFLQTAKESGRYPKLNNINAAGFKTLMEHKNLYYVSDETILKNELDKFFGISD